MYRLLNRGTATWLFKWLLLYTGLLAHGVAEGDAAFIQGNEGIQFIPFILNVASANAEEIVPDAEGLPLEGTALSRADTGLKSETLTVVVPAYEGIELKAEMKAGQSLAFDWRTDGNVLYTDMHGEPPNAGENEFTSYWKENQQSAGQGTLVAQFEGTHGWYWQNMSEDPVTVTVDVSGFYQKIYEKK